jgi:hypothetical protein
VIKYIAAEIHKDEIDPPVEAYIRITAQAIDATVR